MEGVEVKAGRPSNIDRPTGLPSVPKIFLNTTTRDEICLLPDQYHMDGDLLMTAACSSCSLPDLACDPEILLTHPRKSCKHTGNNSTSKPGAGDGGARRTACSAGSGTCGTKLSVYCSPRVSRREFAPPCVQTENHKLGEYSWLHNADVAKFIKSELNRRESNSSVESDSSLRSASHVSTCATSEYTHFTSCDRLSLPVHDLSPSHPCPLGRLRRIYSNPEAPFIKETPQTDNQMRDSKSCSDLENQTKPMVNHTDLERKLSREAGNLLSPPSLWYSKGGIQSANKASDTVTPPREERGGNLITLGSPPPVDGWEYNVVGGKLGGKGCKEGVVSRDSMIRQWLQGVDPAIVVSQEHTASTHFDYSRVTNT